MNNDPKDRSHELLAKHARFQSGWTADPLTSVEFDTTALGGRVRADSQRFP